MNVRQNEQHRTLVTVTVDGYQGGSGASPPGQYPEHYWHLPNTEPRPEGKSLFRLHTLDIYFWTAEDANSFVAILRKLLRPEQLDLPLISTGQERVMNPVVQRLESVAIQDPAARNEQTMNPGSAISSSNPQTNASGILGKTPKAANSEDSNTYQPLAYNPASPPAPEKIAHREKTPPPPEAETGTGLAAAAYRDESHPRFSSASQPQNAIPYSAYGQSPRPHGYINPPAGQPHNGSYAPPPPQPSYMGGSPQRQAYQNPSVSSSPYVPSSSPYQGAGGYTPPAPGYKSSQAPNAAPTKISFDPPPKDSNVHLHGTETRPLDSPATEILGNSYVSGQPPLQHLQPQYADYLDSRRRTEQPEGGYSNYKYDQSPHHHTPHSHPSNYNVHGEWYQPTEAEAHKHKHHRPSGAGPGQQPGKLEQKAEKVEKGIGRLLKKVEKKIG